MLTDWAFDSSQLPIFIFIFTTNAFIVFYCHNFVMALHRHEDTSNHLLAPGNDESFRTIRTMNIMARLFTIAWCIKLCNHSLFVCLFVPWISQNSLSKSSEIANLKTIFVIFFQIPGTFVYGFDIPLQSTSSLLPSSLGSVFWNCIVRNWVFSFLLSPSLFLLCWHVCFYVFMLLYFYVDNVTLFILLHKQLYKMETALTHIYRNRAEATNGPSLFKIGNFSVPSTTLNTSIDVKTTFVGNFHNGQYLCSSIFNLVIFADQRKKNYVFTTKMLPIYCWSFHRKNNSELK